MNLDLRNNIIMMLEDYQKSTQQIALLRYEIAHPQEISHREMMKSMIFLEEMEVLECRRGMSPIRHTILR